MLVKRNPGYLRGVRTALFPQPGRNGSSRIAKAPVRSSPASTSLRFRLVKPNREAQQAERASREERRNNAKAQFSKRIENLNDTQKLYRMRDNLQQEIKTAENNILFFTTKSKGANKLVDNMQRKIDELKAQLAEVKEKIKAAEEEDA